MTRRTSVGPAVVVAALVIGSVAAVVARRQPPERVLELEVRPAAPSFSLDNVDPDQPPVHLADYRANRWW